MLMAHRVHSIRKLDGWAVGTLLRPAFTQPMGKRPDRPDEGTLSAAIRRSIFGVDESAKLLYFRERLRESMLLPDKILLEFVNLRKDDDEAALTFLEKYGVFDSAHRHYSPFDRHSTEFNEQPPKPVMEFLNADRDSFAVALHDFWEVHDRLRVMLALVRAIHSRNSAAVAEACRILHGHVEVDEEREWLGMGRLIFCQDISRELTFPNHGLTLVATETDGIIHAAATSLSLRPALFLALLAQATLDAPIGTCGNPKCRKFFTSTREAKKFCSNRCQQLEKVNRYRAKLRQKGDKKNAKR
jgi:hypothetical protein